VIRNSLHSLTRETTSLVADGSILYFVHVLVDAAGVFGADIWYVRKEP